MLQLEIELLVYDEIEYFRKYDDPEFNYPFSRRKNKIGQYTFNIEAVEDGDY